MQNVVFKSRFFFEGAKCRLKAVFKISNVYKALLILPEDCKHPNLVLNLSSTKFSAKSKFSTKFSTAVYTTPSGGLCPGLVLLNLRPPPTGF